MADDPAYFTRCAGCDKKLVVQYRHSEAVRAGETGLRDIPEGVKIELFALANETVSVCPGRGVNGSSVTCRIAAMRKSDKCPICASTVYRWPKPCDRCVKYVAEGMEQAEVNKSRNDNVKAYVVHGTIEGVYGKFGDKGLAELFSEVLRTMGADERVRGATTEVIDFKLPDVYAERRGAIVALFSEPQAVAIRTYLKALNIQVSRELAGAVETGADLLKGLINGSLTFDGLSDQVAQRVARYQKQFQRLEEKKE